MMIKLEAKSSADQSVMVKWDETGATERMQLQHFTETLKIEKTESHATPADLFTSFCKLQLRSTKHHYVCFVVK